MSIFENNHVLGIAKKILKATIYRPGSIATILAGPLRGCKYAISDYSGWAPIYGGWEPEAQRAYEALVLDGQTVFDLGANTGIHSLLFAKLVGPAGRIIAFEPLPANVDEINRTISLNGVSNVTIVAKAVGSDDGVASFKVGKHGKQGSLVGIGCESGTSSEVIVITLDSFVEQSGVLPDFIKIDIEGAESRALEGFSRCVNRSFPTFAIDLHTPEQDLLVGKWLNEAGYGAYRLVRPGFRPFLKTPLQEYFRPIPRMDLGWPAPDGIWGTIIAVHPKRMIDSQFSRFLPPTSALTI